MFKTNKMYYYNGCGNVNTWQYDTIRTAQHPLPQLGLYAHIAQICTLFIIVTILPPICITLLQKGQQYYIEKTTKL